MLTFDVNDYLQEVENVLKRADEVETKSNQLRSVAEDADLGGVDDTDLSLGQILSGESRGDANWRTLQHLLKMVDQRGFERSVHQLQFHAAFERSSARIIYRDSWNTDKPNIMAAHGWDKVSSEVMISTPRRFGKTFRFAFNHTCLFMVSLFLYVVVVLGSSSLHWL
jgi:hypothetical protein